VIPVDTLLEQTAGAARALVDEPQRVVRLDVLGEDEHADIGMGRGDLRGGLQSLGGVGRRHPDVDDRGVGGSWLTAATSASLVPTAAVTETGATRELALGSDYVLTGGGSPYKLYVTRLLLTPGTGLTSGGDAHFFVSNYDSAGASVKPIVGCVSAPAQTGQAAAQPSDLAVRVREARVRPSDRARYVHRCRTGERLVHGAPGVLFHTRRPPSAREVRQVTLGAGSTTATSGSGCEPVRRWATTSVSRCR
jgi:hypothetical protein